MAINLNATEQRRNPYLAQFYARYGTSLQEDTTGPNDLRNALNNYNYHLKNRKNIGQKRPNQY